MTEFPDTVAQGAQDTGPAAASAATIAPELQPLSLETLPTYKPPIELLPNELLSNIFGFLDSPKPSSSESVLHDEPHFELTKSDNAPLKAVACVSKRWRRSIIPLLFKHAQFTIKAKEERWPTVDQMIKPFLEFIIGHQLRTIVKSFTFIVHQKAPGDIIDRQERSFGFSTFWSGLFNAMDPQELLLVAPAEALGIFTRCRVYMTDAWSFDCPCHYLRLQRGPVSPSRSTKVPRVQHKPPMSTSENAKPSEPELSSFVSAKSESGQRPYTIWDVRPWTSLLLNEGSFIRAYATYEFWLRKSPSVSYCSRTTNCPRLTIPLDLTRSRGSR